MMNKTFVYLFLSLMAIFVSNGCLKYKELSNIKGLEMEVQGATPLFSYELTIQDLLFKTIGFDSTKFVVNTTNKIYFSRQDISSVNSIVSTTDSLYKNIPISSFLGSDSVSFLTSGLADIGIVLGAMTQPPYSFTFPVKQGKMKISDNIIDIIQLDKLSGKIKLKVTNSYIFPIKIIINFPELSNVLPVEIDTLGRNASMDIEVDINNATWVGTQNNVINYDITTTIINPTQKASISLTEIENVRRSNTKIEDTFSIKEYSIIFGDVGKNRYLFKDSIRQKINITDPFILNPNNNSFFPNLSLTVNYENHTLGIAATAVMYDASFKMKDGSIKKVFFFDNLTNTYTQDSFVFPSKIDPMDDITLSSIPKTISFSLDTSNTNFQELDLNLKELDSFFYSVKFYSPEDGVSAGRSSFIRQPEPPKFVNSTSGILFIPYNLKSEIFIDTSKTSVVNIPEKFYNDIENIIKNRSGGELQEIELSMTVENYTIFEITPQIYFMDNNVIIDSFSTRETIPSATLSVGGIVRIPNIATITKKLTPAQWEQLKQCNRLTSDIFLKTSSQVAFPAITSDMYVKFYFKIGNVSFKYLIKKE